MKCRVGSNGLLWREGFVPHQSVTSDRTIDHRAMMALAFIAGIEMNYDVAAMLVVLEKGGFDVIMDPMNLVDIEVARHHEVEVDVLACSGTPAPKAVKIDPGCLSRPFEKGCRRFDERLVGLIHQSGNGTV